MFAFSAEETRARLKRRDPEVYRCLLETEGPQLYTFVSRLCLGNLRCAAEMFRLSMISALRQASGLSKSVDTWLYTHVHRTWNWYQRDKKSLGSRPSHLSFDWTRPIGKQTEDCLEILAPAARELFLLRVMKKFPLSDINTITAISESRLQREFAEILLRLINT